MRGVPIEPPAPPRDPDGAKPTVPAVEGWFTLGDEPHLVGKRCRECAAIVFPPRALACPNPACASLDFDDVPLGRTGRIWSYATNHYPPPAPYVAADPFEPYTVAAVELDDEHLVVLGQLPRGTDPQLLRIGQRVELTVGPLFSTDEHTQVVWQWTPLTGDPA